MVSQPIAVQLFTVRREMAEDLASTLEHIAEMGYTGVELWFPTYPPVDELKAMLDACRLQIAGAHVPYLHLRDDLETVIRYHGTLGNSDLVIPVIPEELRRTAEDWQERIAEIVEIGRCCKEAGFRLSYHNHAMEFQDQVGDTEVHDLLFASVDSDLLKAELDTYFIQDLGRDPAEYIRRYAGRVPLLHLKDKAPADTPYKGTELGRGTIAWDDVLRSARESGVEWYIIEQNCEERPALESIAINLEFLRPRLPV